jgi:hypothetical protein
LTTVNSNNNLVGNLSIFDDSTAQPTCFWGYEGKNGPFKEAKIGKSGKPRLTEFGEEIAKKGEKT